jgi:hypothetical protein
MRDSGRNVNVAKCSSLVKESFTGLPVALLSAAARSWVCHDMAFEP